MRLVENLRKAEKKGTTAIRRGVERAREEWADVERRLRQRMRIYPQKSRAMAAAAPHAGTAALPGLDETADQTPDTTEQRPIISVNGRDVD
jgi:hypothetical protein